MPLCTDKFLPSNYITGAVRLIPNCTLIDRMAEQQLPCLPTIIIVPYKPRAQKCIIFHFQYLISTHLVLYSILCSSHFQCLNVTNTHLYYNYSSVGKWVETFRFSLLSSSRFFEIGF
jgi:hypothetical protein